MGWIDASSSQRRVGFPEEGVPQYRLISRLISVFTCIYAGGASGTGVALIRPVMNRPGVFEKNNVVAWLILGYLCSHPDAKDTVAGVGKWWLRSEGIEVEMRRVRSALDYLVQWGWLRVMGSDSGVIVYGLNKERLPALQRFVQGQSMHH